MSHFKGEDIKVGLPNFQANKSILEQLVEKLKSHGTERSLKIVIVSLKGGMPTSDCALQITMSHFKGEDIKVGLPNFQANKSILELLVEKLKENGEETAMIEVETGFKMSYEDLLQCSMSLAAGLGKVGVTPGDVVVLCCEKSTVLAMTLLLGAMYTGATVMIIAPTQSGAIKRIALNNKTVKAIFYDTTCQDVIQETLTTLNSPPPLVSTIDWNSPQICDLKKTEDRNFSVYNVQDTRCHVPAVMTSSGTTGVPKIIPQTDFSLQYLAWNNPMDDIKSHLLCIPMAWLTTVMILMRSILSKFTIIIFNCKVPKMLLEKIDKYQIESLLMGPSLLHLCAVESYNQLLNYDSIKLIQVGGELYTTAQARTIMASPLFKSRPNLYVTYGSTEANLLSTLLVTELSAEYNTGCCGKPKPGVEIKVVDEGNNTLPIGEIGLVMVRSPAMTPGYWDQPELNQRVFLEDGFFMTGDLGYMDHEGTLYLRGRDCDSINYRGFKFAAVDIEDILLSHPDVQDVIVISQDHPLDIQHAKAFVVKKSESNVSEQILESYVNDKVKEPMRLRGGVHFIEEIPRTGVKPLRNVLRRL